MPITTDPQAELCNQAFRALGEKPIGLPLDLNHPRWLLANQFYDVVQDELLTEHYWAFATVRAELSASEGAVWGWAYSYALPDDYLAMQRSDESAFFQREGAVLLSNENPLNVTYTKRVVDVGLWPPYFIAAFAAALTATFAEQITGQLEKHKVWLEIAGRRLARAAELNALEGAPVQGHSAWASGAGRNLVNQALRALGDFRRPARFLLSDAYFDYVRDKLLTAHFWNFATVRAVLDANPGESPAWGDYGYVFTVPDDYLSIQRVQTGQRYQREGATFVADEPTLSLTYTRRVADVLEWPAQFQTAFVTALTAELAMQVPEAAKAVGAFLDVAERALRTAKMHDGQEGSPPVLRSRDLVNARFGRRNGP